jgi:hypothetical protein
MMRNQFVIFCGFLGAIVGGMGNVRAALPQSKVLFGFDPLGDTMVAAQRLISPVSGSLTIGEKTINGQGDFSIKIGSETYQAYNKSQRKLQQLEAQFQKEKTALQKRLNGKKTSHNIAVITENYNKIKGLYQQKEREYQEALADMRKGDFNTVDVQTLPLLFPAVGKKLGNPKDVTAVIMVHGFGAHKTDFGFIPTKYIDLIRFSFYDSGSLEDSSRILKLRKINLGQQADAFIVLYCLAACYEAGYGGVAFFAHCRGASAVIYALEMLENPDLYRGFWKKLGYVSPEGNLNMKAIFSMKRLLQKGLIVLARPLLDLQAVAKRVLANKLPEFTKLPQFVQNLGQKGVELVTAVKLSQKEPIDRLEDMVRQYISHGASFPYRICVFIGAHDPKVFNSIDDRLISLEQLTRKQIRTFIFTADQLNKLFFKEPMDNLAAHIHETMPDASLMLSEYIRVVLWYMNHPGEQILESMIPKELQKDGRQEPQVLVKKGYDILDKGLSDSDKKQFTNHFEKVAQQIQKALAAKGLTTKVTNKEARTVLSDGLTLPKKFFADALVLINEMQELARSNKLLDEKKRYSSGLLSKLSYKKLELQDTMARLVKLPAGGPTEQTNCASELAEIYDGLVELYGKIIDDSTEYVQNLA